MSTPPTPDPAYEIVLRETQRRVEIPASDADLASMHRGRRRLDHRAAEISRLLEILKKAQKKLKGRHDALLAESEAIGQISDREKVERLVPCEVVHDARQGGVIFIRRRDTRDPVPGTYRPLSAEERNVFADLKPQPDLLPGMSPTVDEELAKKLRLSEYLADAAPADIDAQIESALDASALAPELQDALLTIEADANEEDEKPKAKKPKKEKAPAAPKESKAKGKGGRKKNAAPPALPPPADEPEAEDDASDEPGPAEMEPDEPEKPALPRRPDAPRAVPQPPEDEPSDDANEEAAAGETDAAETADDSASDAAPESEDGTEAESDGDDIPDYDVDSGEEPSPEQAASPTAEDPYPGAYDADADAADPEWVDPAAPVAAPTTPAAEAESEPVAKAEEPATPESPPAAPVKKVRKKDAPEKKIEAGYIRDVGFPELPPFYYDKASGPAKLVFRYFVFDEVDRVDSMDTAESYAEEWRQYGAVDVKIECVVDPARAPAPPTPAPPPAPEPPPPPPAAPTSLPANERTVDNHFGLSPAIGGRFLDALLQQLAKQPLLASKAVAAMERHLKSNLTDNMKLAVLPALNHLATEQRIQRRAAGGDFIFYIHEPSGGFDAWHATERRRS